MRSDRFICLCVRAVWFVNEPQCSAPFAAVHAHVVHLFSAKRCQGTWAPDRAWRVFVQSVTRIDARQQTNARREPVIERSAVRGPPSCTASALFFDRGRRPPTYCLRGRRNSVNGSLREVSTRSNVPTTVGSGQRVETNFTGMRSPRNRCAWVRARPRWWSRCSKYRSCAGPRMVPVHVVSVVLCITAGPCSA